MENLVTLNTKRVFSLQDARHILPIVFKITEDASKKVRHLSTQIEGLRQAGADSVVQFESEIAETIDRWQEKIEKLGASPKGLWLADFDNGKGYFCWKYPEADIQFWHGYNDGYSGRNSIDKYRE